MDVSVIVPIYNVEAYLIEALDSIAAQEGVSLEVLLIDDGSTDRSGPLAKEYAETHEDFVYHRKQNGGQADARNMGVKLARGDYLSFVDPDDLLEPGIFARMVSAARRDGSQIAIFNEAKMNSSRVWPSHLHTHVFNKLPALTTIHESPQLLYDTSPCNKLYLRSFYLDSGLSFPKGLRYEDIPLTLMLHFMASSVTTVDTVGYYWRVREEGILSTTQRNRELRNLQDRLSVIKMVDTFLHETHQPQHILHAWQVRQLRIDLMVFTSILPELDEEQAAAFARLINEHIDQHIDESLIDELTTMQREKLRCVRQGDLRRLAKLVTFQERNKDLPVRESDGRLYATLPHDLFQADEADVTNDIFPLNQRRLLSQVAFGDDELSLTGAVFFRRVSMAAGEQQFSGFLRHQMTGEVIPLDVEPHPLPWMQGTIGAVESPLSGETVSYDCTGYGFMATLTADALANGTRLLPGSWNVYIEYRNRFCSGRVLLANPRRTARTQEHGASIVAGSRVEVRYTRAHEVVLRVEPVAAQIVSTQATDRQLLIEVDRPLSGAYLLSPDTPDPRARPALPQPVAIEAARPCLLNVLIDAMAPNQPYLVYGTSAPEEACGVLTCAPRPRSYDPVAAGTLVTDTLHPSLLSITLHTSQVARVTDLRAKFGHFAIFVGIVGGTTTRQHLHRMSICLSDGDEPHVVLARRPHVLTSLLGGKQLFVFKPDMLRDKTAGLHGLRIVLEDQQGNRTCMPLYADKPWRKTLEWAGRRYILAQHRKSEALCLRICRPRA